MRCIPRGQRPPSNRHLYSPDAPPWNKRWALPQNDVCALSHPALLKLTSWCKQEAVTVATEQAKDAVQQAGEQVQTRVQQLERMQQEIESLKEAPVSVAEDAQNQLRIHQLEQDILQVQQEINVTLEIVQHEVEEVSCSS